MYIQPVLVCKCGLPIPFTEHWNGLAYIKVPYNPLNDTEIFHCPRCGKFIFPRELSVEKLDAEELLEIWEEEGYHAYTENLS